MKLLRAIKDTILDNFVEIAVLVLSAGFLFFMFVFFVVETDILLEVKKFLTR